MVAHPLLESVTNKLQDIIDRHGWKLSALVLAALVAPLVYLGDFYSAGGALSLVTGVALMLSSGKTAPRPCWRALQVAFILSFTGMSSVVIMHLKRSIREVVLIALTCVPACVCTSLDHPPSLYTRRVFKTVCLIWVANTLRFKEYSHKFAPPEPIQGFADRFLDGFAANQQRFVQPMLFAYFICTRLSGLQDGFERPIGVARVKVCFALQLIVEIVGHIVMHAGFPVPSSLPFNWEQCCHLVAGFFSSLSAVFAMRAYWRPFRVLVTEAHFNDTLGEDELASRELWWAVRALLMEAAGTFLTISSTSLVYFVYGFDSQRNGLGLVYLSNKVDGALNCFGIALLNGGAGTLWGTVKKQQMQKLQQLPRMASMAVSSVASTRASGSLSASGISSCDPAWIAKVADLGTRGILLEELLNFYKLLYEEVPEFRPCESTLFDVVTAAILPMSRSGHGGEALATLWSKGAPRQPEIMVTHCWRNVFTNLVAALLADALGRREYAELAGQLCDGSLPELVEEARQRGALQRVYWICAFCVNQHSTMCHKRGCTCAEPKTAKLGPNQSEVNKFDDMMAFMSRRAKSLSQIVAMDADFSLVGRAWCVAELVEAYYHLIPQKLYVPSAESLEQHRTQMQDFDVRQCKASDPNDVDFILAKINDKDKFNNQVRALIFGHRGLLSKWIAGNKKALEVGHVAARVSRRASLTNSDRDRSFKGLDSEFDKSSGGGDASDCEKTPKGGDTSEYSDSTFRGCLPDLANEFSAGVIEVSMDIADVSQAIGHMYSADEDSSPSIENSDSVIQSSASFGAVCRSVGVDGVSSAVGGLRNAVVCLEEAVGDMDVVLEDVDENMSVVNDQEDDAAMAEPGLVRAVVYC